MYVECLIFALIHTKVVVIALGNCARHVCQQNIALLMENIPTWILITAHLTCTLHINIIYNIYLIIILYSGIHGNNEIMYDASLKTDTDTSRDFADNRQHHEARK